MNVAIIGSRGFIGQHLTRHMLTATPHSLVLVNRSEAATPGSDGRAVSRVASLLDARSLEVALSDADVVINLASPQDSLPTAWTAVLAGALRSGTSRRLVHCSTAVVAGSSPDATIDESTVAQPVTPYERTKLSAETHLREHLAGRIALTIARPTVVFGAGGQNLVSLATSLLSRQHVRDQARRALFGDRPMHLVPVATVVKALAFLVDRDLGPLKLFQVAADDDPDNTYRGVERRLCLGLGLPSPRGTIVLPPSILRTALRLRGRSDSNPHRRYTASALRACGFAGGEPVGDAVESFGRWFAGQTSGSR